MPFSYDDYRRQQERWTAGTSEALRTYFWPIFRSDGLSWVEKLSNFRQNSYFFSNVLTLVALAMGVSTISWIFFLWNSYEVEYYLYIMQELRYPILIQIYICIASSFLGPISMISVFKKSHQDLVYVPIAIWNASSIIYTYLSGNIK